MINAERQYDRSVESLRSALGDRVGDPGLAAASPKLGLPRTPADEEAGTRRPWWILAVSMLGLCGGLTLMYVAFNGSPSAVQREGFSRVLSLDGELGADQYLTELAVAAEGYLAADTAVASQMVALEQDCVAMARREHPPLTAADRDWLRAQFSRWAGQAAEIAGVGDTPTARGEARDLLVGIVDTLYREAALVSTR